MRNNRQPQTEKLKISLNSSTQLDEVDVANITISDQNSNMKVETFADDTDSNAINESNAIIKTEFLHVAEIEQDCGHIENVIDNYIAPPVEQAEVFLIKEYLESYKNTIIDEMTKKFELSDFEDRKKTKQREFDNLENLIIARKEALNDISQKIELLRDEWVYGCRKAIDDLISTSLFEFESKILNT